MSLRWFHLLFVTLSTFLFWGLAAACFYQYNETPEQKGYFIGGIVGSVLGLGLLGYGILFYFKMKRLKKDQS